MKVTASAPAKTILTGEHFVVYDEPAVVMAIDRRVRVTVEERSDAELHISSDLGVSGAFIGSDYRPEMGGLETKKTLEPIRIAAQTVLDTLGEKRGLDITVDSDIPVAVGLGSSGALAVATVAATGRLLGASFTRREIADLPFEAERFVHVKPSGIDQTIATYGGVIVYRRSEGIVPLKAEADIPIVIGNTGILRITGKLVELVRIRKERFPGVMDPLIRVAGQLSRSTVRALQDGDMKRLGELLDINHGMLSAIGVSNEALDRLVHAARRGGALGAKLTGAGGGGCMIALSTVEGREEVARAIHEAGGVPMIARKTDRGVRVWVEG
ncbi:MAG: mevalonate kinase [Candidatus Bathyarchaeia archaeon]